LTITILPVKVAGDIEFGDNIGQMILESARSSGTDILSGDIIVVAQKIVSKSEGRVVRLQDVRPSRKAMRIAAKIQKDPRIVELILRESSEVVRLRNGILITETRYGFVCANSGVDQSNLSKDGTAVLLPEDPDRSARNLRSFFKRAGLDVAVIITDTFGRPFREGQTNVAVGLAGLRPIKSYIGKKDMFGKKLRVTEIAVVDEVASAAELVMGKSGGVPAAIVRGYKYERSRSSAHDLVRPKKQDLFR
jgi:coenzyme F420-0:L-glutamate ligase/coenzyme F420-1:gamma-L-glutamate ligase